MIHYLKSEKMGKYTEKTCEIKHCEDIISVIRECPCGKLVFVCLHHGDIQKRVRTPHEQCKDKHGKRKLRKAIDLPDKVRICIKQ